jgi:hypothetical protein
MATSHFLCLAVPVGRRDPGQVRAEVCLWASAMLLSEDCHANVDECLRMATAAATDTEKASWLALAQCWLLLAHEAAVSVTASSVQVAGASPAEDTKSVQGRVGWPRRTHRQIFMLWLTTTAHAAISDSPAIVFGLL